MNENKTENQLYLAERTISKWDQKVVVSAPLHHDRNGKRSLCVFEDDLIKITVDDG